MHNHGMESLNIVRGMPNGTPPHREGSFPWHRPVAGGSGKTESSPVRGYLAPPGQAPDTLGPATAGGA